VSVWAATQKLVYGLLVADAGVHAYVADRVYDGVPADPVYPYISFGPSDCVSDDAECIVGRMETMQIDVWSSDQSRMRIAKEICDTVKAALHETTGSLDAGALVLIRVETMRVQPDPDGIMAHGIVPVTLMVEES